MGGICKNIKFRIVGSHFAKISEPPRFLRWGPAARGRVLGAIFCMLNFPCFLNLCPLNSLLFEKYRLESSPGLYRRRKKEDFSFFQKLCQGFGVWTGFKNYDPKSSQFDLPEIFLGSLRRDGLNPGIFLGRPICA